MNKPPKTVDQFVSYSEARQSAVTNSISVANCILKIDYEDIKAGTNLGSVILEWNERELKILSKKNNLYMNISLYTGKPSWSKFKPHKWMEQT